MNLIEEKCKSKGVRLTDQRRIIAQVMSESKDHPDVDELHKRVSDVDKKISIATVYRTVKLFEEFGILEKHDFKGGKARYEQSPKEHHDHLIDINSGEIVEFVDKDIEKLQNEVAKKLGYKLVDHKLELYGSKIKNKLLKKIFIKTLGCQMNEYDSNRILDITKKINYTVTHNLKEADCYVLNTCHIREKATDKVYHDIGRLKKEFRNKNKPITIIAGCVAQAEGDILLKKEKYIDAIVGPQSYHDINEIILKVEKNFKKINYTEFNVINKFDQLHLIKNLENKISSFLTIQEGCDKFCNFCVVPYTRGSEFSRSFSEILSEAKQLVNNGSMEITLLGQNVNAYSYKNKKLSDLIFELNEIKNLRRIRYTTSHPNDVTDDLIDAHYKCKKLMPLLHLPVQSGSNKILKNMNRKHSIEMYYEKIEKLKNKKNGIKFSSDFIIAYPGESLEDFNETLLLMKKIKFINSYSFIFSSRPGTPASKMKNVDINTAKERLQIFQHIANNIKMDYRKSLINTTAKVLFENRIREEKKYFGRDEYNNSVIASNDTNLTGTIQNVKILTHNHNTLFGEVLTEIKSKEFAA